MRLAVTADTNDGLGSLMAARYDNAPFFVLVDIDPQSPTPRRVRGVENPWWGAHGAAEVAAFLRPMRVAVVVAGTLDPRDARYLQAAEIYPVTGAAGDVGGAGGVSASPPCSSMVRGRSSSVLVVRVVLIMLDSFRL